MAPHFVAGAVRGIIAGGIATLPMTWAMRAMENRLRIPGRIPPQQITDRMANRMGVDEKLPAATRDALTDLAHYGFGAAAGGLLGASMRYVHAPAPVTGALVGLGVWTASYLGWLPAAGLRRPATREPARRNAQMLVAHLVWGAVAGSLIDQVSLKPENAAQNRSPLLPAGRLLRGDFGGRRIHSR
jgi:hypothetical protein